MSKDQSFVKVPPSPVHLEAVTGPNQPEPTPELRELYRGFEAEMLVPLWTEISGLMPVHPNSKATPHLWRWDNLIKLAEQAGTLVPVGRGGERRAIALANPSLGGQPFATPTLWAAIQYLMPGENAPEHRHTQHAFRFVLEGEGVWTVVNGDPVRMSRGDFLPQGGWNWHAHHNAASEPMAWIDGLDIPFSYNVESQFFEFGRDNLDEHELASPDLSRSERLWSHPGLRPVSNNEEQSTTPLLAYRWEDTNRALSEQLALEAEGYDATVELGHAAVRYTNPTNGRDVLPTIRVEMHRIKCGSATQPRREVGSSVFLVFEGQGVVTVGNHTWDVQRGDMFVVPSWQSFAVQCDKQQQSMDLFRFCDTPIYEAIHAHAVNVTER